MRGKEHKRGKRRQSQRTAAQRMDSSPLAIEIQPGDCIASRDSVPSPNRILTDASLSASKSLLQFNLSALEDYLDFLEMIVLYERIIVAHPDGDRFLSDKDLSSPAAGPALTAYRTVGRLELSYKLDEVLIDRGILYPTILADDSPRSHIRSLLTIDEGLRNLFQSEIACLEALEPRRDVCSRLAEFQLIEDVGLPMFIGELSREYNVPYRLADREQARLKHADRIEAVIRKGVIATLRERLDAGARRELERLEAIAGPTVFPRTPIATSIIHDSAGPEDLLRIALELREEFTGFRQAMRELETELFSEETDLRHRIRILNDIEGISRELWPTPRDGFRASFVEATGLITKVADLTPGSTVTQLHLIAQILSKPVEAVLRGIKRRKIRVLLQAKRDFLKSKRHTDKIKEIFRLTDRQVSTAIESVAESKHETVSTGPDSIGSIR